jgi:hypothetical protein
MDSTSGADRGSVASPRRIVSNLRWWIGALLFASTVINYIDRQTLSVLGPHLKTEFHWSNQDFALIVIAFRVAYAVMQTVSGRFVDRLGTRKGLTLSVVWYSCAAMLTSLAGGLASFCGFRFLLGAGEAANWPAATKAVGEWFPRRERGLAVARDLLGGDRVRIALVAQRPADDLARPQPQEAVAPHALALLGGLQQECRELRVEPAQLQEGRDGRLAVVEEAVAQRDDVVVAGELADLVQRWLHAQR